MIIKNTQEYTEKILKIISDLDLDNINKIIDLLLRAYKNDNSVFIMGNGGSASTASHFACDLSKGTLGDYYNFSKKRFKVYSLTDNVAVITAYGNDLGFEDIFIQQLKNLIGDGDIVISISASGNSENIVKAMKFANENNATTVAFLGFDGGKVADISDYKIIIKNNHYGVIEDAHMIISHMISSILKDRI